MSGIRPAPPPAVARRFLGDARATQGDQHPQRPSSKVMETTPAAAATAATAAASPSPSTGASFAALFAIVEYLPPEAPLALVACSPCTRLALETREKGCVLPGNLCFERRPGPPATEAPRRLLGGETGTPKHRSRSGSSYSSEGSSVSGESLNSEAGVYLSPPQELCQFLTSHKTSTSWVAGQAAGLRPTTPAAAAAAAAGGEEGGATAAVAAGKMATRTSAAPKEAPTPELLPQRALQYALWWLRRLPLPVSLSLYRFDPNEVKALTAQLQSLPRTIVLRELALHGRQVSDVTPFLPHCADVRALALRNTHLTSENLSVLPKSCRHVERLSLCMSSSVSGTQFLRHRALRTLRDLDLSYTQVTEDGVSRDVSTLKKLSRLSLEGCRKIEGLQWVQTLTRLRELDLAYSGVTDSSLTALCCCAELTKLDLQWCGRLTNLHCVVGALCESLRELNLTETSVTNEGLAPLRDFVALEWISLEGCSALSDVNVLGNLKALREVDVGRTRVTNEGVVSLAQCQALRVVRLRQCYRLTDVNFLGALQLLEEVDVSDCPVTNAGIAALHGARAMRRLRLQSCRAVSDVNFLGGLEHLTLLDLYHTSVDEAGSAALALCPQLTTLIMHSVLAYSLQQWSAALFLPRLKELDLSNTNVTPAALSFLAWCPGLVKLSLRGCRNVTHVGFLLLRRSPDAEPCATVDDFVAGAANTSGDSPPSSAAANTLDGARPLLKTTTTTTKAASAAEVRHRLKELTLSDTGVTDDGLRALRYCLGLERLRLAHCGQLSDVAVLRWLSQLKELDLSATGVTSRGLARLSPSGNLPVREQEEEEEERVGGAVARGTPTIDPPCLPTGCIALEKLWLRSCVQLEDVRLLCGFPQLEELFLTDTPLRRGGLDLAALYRRNPRLKQIHHNSPIAFA
ncbi:uncharacterized protein Tco025E_02261 [Trypanosoma conorhini]|uniref:Leucine-rich repeat protein (LRRP) n=1 Tax=Trypanosoma conorhini TaxID=83891 RepID=A0A3R7LC12_9TRYP|nr:uncharacterized protein Tco025E_02261 [Trypanosoma conorhini]RNF25357.1 hypothetical protein Tco025E_02261 [Trypanosoma conorhini]